MVRGRQCPIENAGKIRCKRLTSFSATMKPANLRSLLRARFAKMSIASVSFLWIAVPTGAQTVEILAADQISRDPNITEAQRLIGHVKLGHQDAVLTCDSAWRFDDGKVEVFGDVVMRQPPATTMNARHVVIQPGEDWAQAEGDVAMVHEGARLEAPSLSYLIKARQARYGEGARIQDDGWTVTSRRGRTGRPKSCSSLAGRCWRFGRRTRCAAIRCTGAVLRSVTSFTDRPRGRALRWGFLAKGEMSEWRSGNRRAGWPATSTSGMRTGRCRGTACSGATT